MRVVEGVLQLKVVLMLEPCSVRSPATGDSGASSNLHMPLRAVHALHHAMVCNTGGT
jgi:hypothetical protein